MTKLIAAFLVYAVVAAGLTRGATLLPEALQPAAFAFCAPMFLLLTPLAPVLSRLGLMEGEYWRTPSALGVLLGAALYAAVLYGIMRAFQGGSGRG